MKTPIWCGLVDRRRWGRKDARNQPDYVCEIVEQFPWSQAGELLVILTRKNERRWEESTFRARKVYIYNPQPLVKNPHGSGMLLSLLDEDRKPIDSA